MKNLQLNPVYRFLRVPQALSVLFLLFVANASRAQVNRALDFIGTSTSYADLGTLNPSGNFSTGLTIECWVKWDAFNTWSRLADIGNGNGTGTGSDNILFCNEGTTANLRYEVYRGATTQGLSSPAPLVTGRWYHVAVTQTATGFTTLYVDGVAVVTATVQTPNNLSRTKCYIGHSAWPADGYLDGKVDEMRIWNVVRTATEIRQNMLKTVASNAAGLVAYYRCNEGSGPTLVNSATNGGSANGSIVGGTTWVSSPAQLVGNAIGLDGTDDYVSIGSPLAAGSSYTKEAWVYITKNVSLPQNVISSQGSPVWIGGGVLVAGNTGSAPQVSDPNPFPTNTWVHVAVSYDAGTKAMILYRNGVQVASANVTNAYIAQNNNIGAWYNGTSYEANLGGKIDEVRIWNVARSPSQIMANMNRELDAAAEANLVAYYTFNQGTTEGDNTGMITVADQKGTTNGVLTNMVLSGTASNFVQQQAGFFVLPVSFASFTAQKGGGNVLLQWITASEQKASRFVVEHSTDGQRWTALDEISAAGNSNSLNRYSYVHTAPAKALHYYRIALRDEDGKLSYTTVRTVSLNDDGKAFTVLNTTITNEVLQLQVARPTALSLYTPEGRLLWSKEMTAGLQNVPVGGIAKGIYFLSGAGTTEKLQVK